MSSPKRNMAIRRRIVSAWISTVISLALVLLLVGVGTLLLVNARAVSDYFKENMQVSVLLKQQVNEEEAQRYESEVRAVPGVRSTHFVSREQGVEEMARMLGQDFLDVFESAPVPISIDVNLEAAYVSSDSLEVIKSVLAESPLVEEVVYQTSLVDALNANLQKISLGLAVLVALLLFISFVLIANTIRLELFNRRFSIHTMHLVGATKGYIRAPFVGRAALQGLFAALFAILLLVGGLFVLRDEFAQLFQIFQLETLLMTMGVMVVAGVGICAISTFIVVGRMVGYNRDKLYAY
ncbi:MAG: permease-like cell division protein FtsX [Acidaminococcaceae bacterium]|nr:permease-like cell division protein FtsX [Acidaminococcaceae bacterium]